MQNFDDVEQLLRDLEHEQPDADDVLDLLARMGRVVGSPEIERVLTRVMQVASGVAVDEVLARVDVCVRMPTDIVSRPISNAVRDWLFGLERVALACRCLARGELASLREGMEARLQSSVGMLCDLPELWRYGSIAQRSHESSGPGIAPWQEILAAPLPDEPGGGVLDAWLMGRLSTRQHIMIQAALTDESRSAAWRDALRDAIDSRWGAPTFVYGDPRVALDVLQADVPAELAEVLRRFELPHRGPDVFLTLRPSDSGLDWTIGDQASGRVDWAAGAIEVEDAVLGRLTFRFHAVQQSPAEQRRMLRNSAFELARMSVSDEGVDDCAPAMRRVTFALVEELGSGKLRGALDLASSEDCDIEDPELQDAVADALAVRWALDLVRLDDASQPELEYELFGVDEVLAGCGRAIVDLDVDHFEAIADPIAELAPMHIVPVDAWWGARHRIAGIELSREFLRPIESEPARPAFMVPLRAVAASDELRLRIRRIADLSSKRRPEQFDELKVTLRRQPCLWLRGDLLQELDKLPRDEFSGQIQDMRKPRVGSVPVLLRLLGSDVVAGLAGCIAEISIDERASDSDPVFDDLLGKQALQAIGNAYRAAGSLTQSGLPPRPLDEHFIELRLPEDLDIREVDGASLGAATMLAFLSHWSGAAIDDRLVVSAALRPTGGGWVLERVAHVDVKASVVAHQGRELDGAPIRFVAHREDAAIASTVPGGLRIEAVNTLAEVAQLAGLDPRTIQASWATEPELVEKLRAAMHAVEYQAIEAGPAPWALLADRIEVLVDLLTRDGSARVRDILPEARARGSIAYTHAGLSGPARRILQPLLRDSMPDPNLLDGLSPGMRAYVGTSCLNMLIDEQGRDEQRAEQLCGWLHSTVEGSPAEQFDRVRGAAFGTLGRYWFHRRILDRALPLLRRAVEEHEKNLPGEVGRSRIYLAAALRMKGELQEALDQLMLGAREIKEKTEPLVGHAYAEGCRLYWHYEHARVLLAMGAPREAEHAGYLALRRAEQIGGWWPALGIRRLMVWIADSTGRTFERSTHIEAMDALKAQTPSSWFEVFRADAERSYDDSYASVSVY